MRRICLAAVLILSLPFAPLATGAQQPRGTDSRPFKPEELEHIVAPIALYPDPLVAQIFKASTYPLEVIQAARFAKANPGLKGNVLNERSKTTNGTIASKLWLALRRSSSGWTVSSSGCSSSAKPSSRSKRTLWTPSSVFGRKRSNRPSRTGTTVPVLGPTIRRCPPAQSRGSRSHRGRSRRASICPPSHARSSTPHHLHRKAYSESALSARLTVLSVAGMLA